MYGQTSGGTYSGVYPGRPSPLPSYTVKPGQHAGMTLGMTLGVTIPGTLKVTDVSVSFAEVVPPRTRTRRSTTQTRTAADGGRPRRAGATGIGVDFDSALAIFGDALLPLAGLLEACRRAGWRVIHLSVADQREWDDF